MCCYDANHSQTDEDCACICVYSHVHACQHANACQLVHMDMYTNT